MSSTRIERNRGNGVKGGQFGFARDAASESAAKDRSDALASSRLSLRQAREELIAEANEGALSEIEESYPGFENVSGVRWQPGEDDDGNVTDYPVSIVLYDHHEGPVSQVFLDPDSGEVYTGDDLRPNLDERFDPPADEDRIVLGGPDMWDSLAERYELRISEGGADKIGSVDVEMVPKRCAANNIGTGDARLDKLYADAFDEVYVIQRHPSTQGWQGEPRAVSMMYTEVRDLVKARSPKAATLIEQGQEPAAVSGGLHRRWRIKRNEMKGNEYPGAPAQVKRRTP